MSLDQALARFTRHVPRFRGWHRLLEPLRRHYVRRYQGRPDRWVEIDDFEGDLRMRLDRAALMSSIIYWRGIHSFSEAALIRRHLPPDGVFLDVGANQGELTLVAARHAPRGRVYAFEPVPEWFQLLCENVRLNGLVNVTPVNVALSEAEGVREMFTSDDVETYTALHEGLSSFVRTDTRPVPLGSFPTVPLDTFARREGLERVDLVKIDVEGAEASVLAGGREVIARHRPMIILEWNPELQERGGGGLIGTLREFGYRLFDVDPFARMRTVPEGRLPDHDTLFARHASRH